MMEKGLIERKPLEKALVELAAKSSHSIAILPELARMIRDLPAADAVPVVRCRDCKYFYQSAPGLAICDFWDRPGAWGPACTTEDEYCSHGEVVTGDGREV